MLACTNCGSRVDLPAGFARAKIRCGSCGYYVEVPAAQRSVADDDLPKVAPVATSGKRKAPSEKPKPAAAPKSAKVLARENPIDTRPMFDVEAGGKPILVGTQHEDDDQPYGVPGSGLQKCPHCAFELPLDAVFCVHCGKDIASGFAAAKVKQPMHGIWVEGMPRERRLAIFAGMQVLNLVFFVLTVVENWSSITSIGTLFSMMFFFTFNIALQVFLVGTYDTLIVKRDAKNRTTLTRIRHICLRPLPPMKLQWKESTHLTIVGAHEVGMLEWGTCLYLLLLGCVPGILFYWFVIRPDRFQVNLVDVYGATNEIIFRTKERDIAEEVAYFTGDATGLSYRAV